MHSRNDLIAFKDSAVVACDLLSKVGIDCTVALKESGVYYTMMNNRRMPVGDAATLSGGINAAGVDSLLGTAFHPDGIRNYGGYGDPTNELRDLYTSQSREFDETKRTELVWEYQRKWLNLHHQALMGWRGTAKVWSNQLHGSAMNQTEQFFWPIRFDDTWVESQ